MVEQHHDDYYDKLLFGRANSALKTHGIVAIIFGGLGIAFGLFMLLLLSVGTISDPSYNDYASSLGLFFVAVMAFVFWFLPHAYLITSGIYLTREPYPRLAKVLLIINLVVGIFYNLIIMVFAIINLVQSKEYERGYPHASHTN